MGTAIRQLFSPLKPIDRTIEKVIDYYAQEDERLAAEISEYEITDSIENGFRTFLDAFGDGVESGRSTEIGIWVSGFYGSGKSSFTKYLGAALEPKRIVGGRPFLDHLCDRFQRDEVRGRLRKIAKGHATTVIFLDLGAEQLADNSSATVTSVLYWKVLQWAGFSKEKKTAALEFKLDQLGRYDRFKKLYTEKHKGPWEDIHNDPLIGVARAAEIVPEVLPEDFKTKESFSALEFEEALTIRDIAERIIDLCRRRTKRDNILFMVDEAGQYVAPRGELILNLDGLARNMKELGQGKVWIAATGQQTLTEIVEKAAHNSAELNKLRDRFPISVNLDARDIREITRRRLLEKSEDGRKALDKLFKDAGQSMLTHTKLTGTSLFKGDPDGETFIKLYPFLPQHFDLLLELIRVLARSTGGIGLRSAIRVIQDVLVDKSRVLPSSAIKLADEETGTLACVDDFFDTLRADISRILPHAVSGVDKVCSSFGSESMEARVAKAVAALQPIEAFPRTAENIAALLYKSMGSASLIEHTREALKKLLADEGYGFIEDPQAGGYAFLSDAIRPIKERRNAYSPTSGECSRILSDLLKQGVSDHPLFRSQPSARLENTKEVKAAVRFGRISVVGGGEDVELRLELIDPSAWEEKRKELLLAGNNQVELRNTVVLLARKSDDVEDLLPEIARSDRILGEMDERTADSIVAQYMRSERRAAEAARERAGAKIEKALLEGLFIFRGKATPVREKGETLEAAVRAILSSVVSEIFPYYKLCPIRPATEAASKFISAERLDRIGRDVDPLGLVHQGKGTTGIDIESPVLAEVLRVAKGKLAESGTGRISGSLVQDLFSAPPYGWTKDAVRYLFAALLRAGEIELQVPGSSSPIRTAGPVAADAVKSSVSFNRIGISLRDTPPPTEALDRAARLLESLFGVEVLPLEDNISRAVRLHFPDVIERMGSLPDQLRLLGLSGEARSRQLLGEITDLMKGDAGGAVSILGAVDCRLLEEVSWAREILKAFDSGAEQTLKEATEAVRALKDLHQTFPGTAADLFSPDEMQAVSEVLTSERFFEKLPSLKSVTHSIIAKTQERYAHEFATFKGALEAAQDELERSPQWVRLSDDDRAEIASRLASDLPESAEGVGSVRQLQTLLFRQGTLASLLVDLKHEVELRAPQQDVEPDSDEEVVAATSLLQPVVLQSPEDLDAWLEALRARLAELLKSKKKVRIERR